MIYITLLENVVTSLLDDFFLLEENEVTSSLDDISPLEDKMVTYPFYGQSTYHFSYIKQIFLAPSPSMLGPSRKKDTSK